MKKSTTALIIMALTLLISGCTGSAAIRPVANQDVAAAYGNITLPDQVVTRVMLYKVGEIYAPPFKSPPSSHTYMNGNFFFENLEPGKYFLVGFMSGQNIFYFNYSGLSEEAFIDEVAVDIKPGAVAYLGSYEVTGIDRNFFRSDTFEIKPVKQPGRNTILEHLKEAAAGTGWDQRLAQQIK